MSQDKDALSRALSFYARIKAALFPIPAGSKSPIGIVKSWMFNNSSDPAAWEEWRVANPNCNFGIVAFASRLIIIDIDVVKYGEVIAWQTWCEVCKSWGLPEPIYPHVRSARGGWHVYLKVPDHIDPRHLRQPGLIKGIIDIRVMGYTVAAGSFYDGGGPYEILSEREPEFAPQALLDFVKRQDQKHANGAIARPTGLYSMEKVRALLLWLRDERGGFESYEQWIQTGMILRLEFGDELGWEMWDEATWKPPHPKAPTPEKMLTHWRSFETDVLPSNLTIRSLFMTAHKEEWKGGTIPLSWNAALEQINRTGKPPAEPYIDRTGKTVAALAQTVGATLSSGGGVATAIAPPPGMTGEVNEAITEGQRGAAQARIMQPVVDAFLSAADLPNTPMMRDYPRVPDQAEHPLAKQMQFLIERLIAFGEDRKAWRAARAIDAFAVLQVVHEQTYRNVFSLLAVTMGLSGLLGAGERKINLRAQAFRMMAEAEIRPVVNWLTDHKGRIDVSITDNTGIFCELIGVTVRWNEWLEQIEVQGDEWPVWVYMDDRVVNTLWSKANSNDIRFHIGTDSLWRNLTTLAYKNKIDPALELLNDLESKWDGEHRLAIWLSATVGAPCDLYHQAVGRMIFGNMVRRIREPGCKCDFVPVFWGPQDTGKSTLAQRIAPRPEWFSDGVQLGDPQKELVLLLRGKAVVELAEMATKSGKESEHHKAMISAQVDTGRTAYERTVSNRPRRNIFIGTSNPPPLVDTSGNRRYLPIYVARTIDHEWIKANRNQLIAEACVLHARGDTFNLPAEVRAQAEEQREEARVVTRVESELEHWLGETTVTRSVRWNYITGRDIGVLLERIRYGNTQLSDAMHKLGFRNQRITVDSKQVKCWVRGVEATGAWIVREGLRYVVSKTPDGSVVVRPTLSGTITKI